MPSWSRRRQGTPRLAHHPGTSAQLWLNLQTRYDLAVAEREHGARIAAEVDPAA